MTILLEVFTSKSMKLSPAGLCQRRLVNSRDAELRGNPPHPPELTHRRRGVAGRGRRGEALPPPPAHSRLSLPNAPPRHFLKETDKEGGGSGRRGVWSPHAGEENAAR